MISFEAAIALLADEVSLLGAETVALAAAGGRVLARPLHARGAAPRQAVAAMDGYAVCDATTRPETWLRVVGESRAGAGWAGMVGPGEAVRIFTGAPLPEGTDRCIIQEAARREGDRVSFASGYGPDWHVRAAGSDFAAGALLLGAGTRLSPRAMVAAAAADFAEVVVALRPRVAIIGTGDELAPPGTAHLRPHAIPESVTLGIVGMVGEAGGRVVQCGAAPDRLPELEHAAATALALADLVVVTGGASVGEHDFARAMFAPLGLELLFSKVAIKPGKPVWLGRAEGKWVLGLPGNPTSAMVTARLFLRPLLALLQGMALTEVLRWRSLPLAAGLRATGDRETFYRARWDDAGLVPLGNQDSGIQSGLVAADWLIRCPPAQPAKARGEAVTVLPF